MVALDKYFFIVRENMPRLYALSWDSKTPALVLKVHKDFVAGFNVPLDAPIIRELMLGFKFSHFSCFKPNLFGEQSFGFDGSFVKTGEDAEFAHFAAAIPVFEQLLNEACSDCKGTGKQKEFPGDDCLYCSGTGRAYRLNWQPLYAVSASCTLFFNAVERKFRKEYRTASRLVQLLSVNTVTIRDMHGGSLCGIYSVPLVKFLSSFAPGSTIPEMSCAMTSAWRKMFGKIDDYTGRQLYGQVGKDGWLNIGCPGDACGLNPASQYYFAPGRGYEFSCHNVDNPMQQIALIVGLAALCDKAEAAGVATLCDKAEAAGVATLCDKARKEDPSCR